MTNPLDWKTEHLMGWVASIVVGAILGLVLGYFVARNIYPMMDLPYWIEWHPLEALIWGMLGGLVVGGAVYAIKVFSS